MLDVPPDSRMAGSTVGSTHLRERFDLTVVGIIRGDESELVVSPDQEIEAVVDSVSKWLPEHQDSTVAILVPRNNSGFEVATALKARGIEYVELLRSTRSTREAAGALANSHFLAIPYNSGATEGARVVANFLASPPSARKPE